MSESVEAYAARQMATPAGQVLQRLVSDRSYAAEVASDPDAALAGLDIDADTRAALSADAFALAGAEVEGFGGLPTGPRQHEPLMREVTFAVDFGKLQTPGRLGLELPVLSNPGQYCYHNG